MASITQYSTVVAADSSLRNDVILRHLSASVKRDSLLSFPETTGCTFLDWTVGYQILFLLLGGGHIPISPSPFMDAERLAEAIPARRSDSSIHQSWSTMERSC